MYAPWMLWLLAVSAAIWLIGGAVFGETPIGGGFTAHFVTVQIFGTVTILLGGYLAYVWWQRRAARKNNKRQ
jgi:hypothetical protein